MAFSWLYGQERPVKILHSVLASGRIGGAYLFTGPPGVGKRLAALQFAKALNCLESTTDACDKCTNCRLIDQGQFPDLFVAATKDNRILKGNPSTDKGQGFLFEIVPRLHFAPVQGRTKVVLIDPADRMNDEAASMLLKTMEEPPGATVFVLIATIESAMFATIVSRCQKVRFSPLKPDDTARFLVEKRQMDPELAQSVARAALGSVERALELIESHIMEQKLQVVDLFLGLCSMPLPGRVSAIGRFLSSGSSERDAAQRASTIGGILARDMLLTSCGMAKGNLILAERSQEISALTDEMGVHRVLEFSGAIRELGEGLSHNENPRLLLNHVGSRIAALTKRRGVPPA